MDTEADSEVHASHADPTVLDTSSSMEFVIEKLALTKLGIIMAPMPVGFDEQETRQEDQYYDTMTQAICDIQRIVSALAQRTYPEEEHPRMREFFESVTKMCADIDALYQKREDFIELVQKNGAANLRRTRTLQTNEAQFRCEEPLGEAQSKIWEPFISPRPLTRLEAQQFEGGESAAQYLLPPGGINTYCSWQKRIQQATTEINKVRTPEQIAADPLYEPAFDPSSPNPQTFLDEDGTKWSILPTFDRAGVFQALNLEALGVDDHTLESYNRIASRLLGSDEPAFRLEHPLPFWRIVRIPGARTGPR